MTLSLITLPFGLSFADMPAACPCARPPLGEVCTAQPRRAASSSRKRPAPLMSHSPRAPLEPARCVQRPRLRPPLFAATRRLSEPAGPLPPYSDFLRAKTSSSLLQTVAAMASPPRQPSSALHRPCEASGLSELDVKNSKKGTHPWILQQ